MLYLQRRMNSFISVFIWCASADLMAEPGIKMTVILGEVQKRRLGEWRGQSNISGEGHLREKEKTVYCDDRRKE